METSEYQLCARYYYGRTKLSKSLMALSFYSSEKCRNKVRVLGRCMGMPAVERREVSAVSSSGQGEALEETLLIEQGVSYINMWVMNKDPEVNHLCD